MERNMVTIQWRNDPMGWHAKELAEELAIWAEERGLLDLRITSSKMAVESTTPAPTDKVG